MRTRWTAAVCAAASLVFGTIALSDTANAVPAATPNSAGAVPTAAPASTAHPLEPPPGYRTRPEAADIGLRALGGLPLTTSDEAFFTQGLGLNQKRETTKPAALVGADGEPIWIGPANPADCMCPVVPVRYRGAPGIAYLTPEGTWQFLDAAYQPVLEISAYADVKNTDWFLTTNDEGTRALLIGNRAVTKDLTAHGGDATSSRLVGSVVKEIDLTTGDVLFSWDSIADGPGNVPLDDHIAYSYRWRGVGSYSDLHYLDADSVAYDANGDFLLTARGTRTIYKIDRATGAIVWTLGGNHSSLTPAAGTTAVVDPRTVHGNADGSLSYLELNNEVGIPRWRTLLPDEQAGTVAEVAVREVWVNASGRNFLKSFPVGTLHNGAMWTGDSLGSFDEFREGSQAVAAAAGDVVMLPASRAEWHATPATKPDVVLDMSSPTTLNAYASWNGATEVAAWRLSVGPDAAHLRVVGQAARSGFETRVDGQITTADTVFRIEALASDGTVLAADDSAQIGPIARKYGKLGGEQSALGLATSPVEAWNGGLRQHYVGGDIYWRADLGATAVLGATAKKLEELDIRAGFPTNDTTPTPDKTGTYQLLTTGGIYGRNGGPAFFVTGLEWSKYSKMGWERSPLGYPVGDYAGTANDGRQYFEGGAIDRYPTGTGVRSVEMHGAIYTKFRQGLGHLRPVSDELTTLDGIGRFSHFVDRTTGRTASIYWSPATGAHVVYDIFMAKWAATGYESGIGYPTTDDLPLTPSNVTYQHFQTGSLYPTSDNRQRMVVMGAIRDTYASIGWERSFLRLPTTDEIATPDGYGRFNHFDQGSIYWSPATGAHAITQPTKDYWAGTGWERGMLGYPVTTTANVPGGNGEYTHYQGGSIYLGWIRLPDGRITPVSGSVRGDIRDKWASLGWERSTLGFPLGNEITMAGGVYQRFEHGRIEWTANTRATRVIYY